MVLGARRRRMALSQYHTPQHTHRVRVDTAHSSFVSSARGLLCCAGPDQPGSDYLAHNSTYYYPWLLQQINAYKREYGVCLIDYIDHHWYPYLNGVNSEADPSIQSQLLDQPRSLYDVTFADPAGNTNPVTKSRGPAVIRQLHEWLRLYAPDCPNIEIAITEYAFGGARLHTTALALAEVFSIMAREQLSLATLFQIPTPDTTIYHSFELYNFNGSRVTGDTVHAHTSAPVQQLTAYAQHDNETGVVYVKLFNKGNVTAVNVEVTVTGVSWNSNGAPTCGRCVATTGGRGPSSGCIRLAARQSEQQRHYARFECGMCATNSDSGQDRRSWHITVEQRQWKGGGADGGKDRVKQQKR